MAKLKLSRSLSSKSPWLQNEHFKNYHTAVRSFNEDLEFLTQFENKLKILLKSFENVITTTPETELAKSKVASLLVTVSQKKIGVFDEKRYLEYLSSVFVIQRMFRREIYRRKRQLFLSSASNTNGRKRFRVQKEIVNTEVSYEKQLSLLHNIFYLSLEKKAEEISLSADDLKDIFSNLESILECSRAFVSQIPPGFIPPPSSRRTKNEAWKTYVAQIHFGKILIELGPLFRVYIEYIINFDKSRAKIAELRASNPEFTKLIGRLEKKRELKNLSLESYLILPVQRIPRYILLLTEFIKWTPEEHVDLPALKEALNLLQKVANTLNESKRAAEGQTKLIEVANTIVCPPEIVLVQPHRCYLSQGDLFLCFPPENPESSFKPSLLLRLGSSPSDVCVEFQGEKEQITLFLFNDILVSTTQSLLRNKFRYQDLYKLLGELRVNTLVRYSNPDLFFFELIYPNKTFLFAAKSESEKQRWVMALNQAISQVDKIVEVDDDILKWPLCEGWMAKRGDYLRVWNERFFKLKGKTLFYSLKEGGEVRSKVPNLDTYKIELFDEDSSQPFAFKLKPPDPMGKVIFLATRNLFDFRKWIDVFLINGFRVGNELTSILRQWDSKKVPPNEGVDILFGDENLDEKVREAENEMAALLDDLDSIHFSLQPEEQETKPEAPTQVVVEKMSRSFPQPQKRSVAVLGSKKTSLFPFFKN